MAGVPGTNGSGIVLEMTAEVLRDIITAVGPRMPNIPVSGTNVQFLPGWFVNLGSSNGVLLEFPVSLNSVPGWVVIVPGTITTMPAGSNVLLQVDFNPAGIHIEPPVPAIASGLASALASRYGSSLTLASIPAMFGVSPFAVQTITAEVVIGTHGKALALRMACDPAVPDDAFHPLPDTAITTNDSVALILAPKRIERALRNKLIASVPLPAADFDNSQGCALLPPPLPVPTFTTSTGLMLSMGDISTAIDPSAEVLNLKFDVGVLKFGPPLGDLAGQLGLTITVGVDAKVAITFTLADVPGSSPPTAVLSSHLVPDVHVDVSLTPLGWLIAVSALAGETGGLGGGFITTAALDLWAANGGLNGLVASSVNALLASLQFSIVLPAALSSMLGPIAPTAVLLDDLVVRGTASPLAGRPSRPSFETPFVAVAETEMSIGATFHSTNELARRTGASSEALRSAAKVTAVQMLSEETFESLWKTEDEVLAWIRSSPERAEAFFRDPAGAVCDGHIPMDSELRSAIDGAVRARRELLHATRAPVKVKSVRVR